MIFDFLKKKKYSHFFVYKWGILSGVVETLLIVLSVFTIVSLNSLFVNNPEAILLFGTFYYVVVIILTFLIVLGMPFYLLFKKKMASTALLVLLMTIVTLFVLFTVLFLIVSL